MNSALVMEKPSFTSIRKPQLLAGALLIALYLFFLNPHLDVKEFNQHDPAQYLIRAMTISQGLGYGVAYVDQYLGVTSQPPGFSFLLSPVVGIFGFNFMVLKIFMLFLTGIFVYALIYFFKYFLTDHDWVLYPVLMVMASPVIFGLSHRVMSDIPLFTLMAFALVFLDVSLKNKSSIVSFPLFLAAIFTVTAYSFKLTALGAVAGGWFLFLHPNYRNKQVFLKLVLFTILVFVPVKLWDHWTTTIPDEWYWTHPGKDFFLREPFKSDGSATTIAEFIVRARRNIVYGMVCNLNSILVAPFYFIEGELSGFILGLPIAIWLFWQWLKSYMKVPSVLEGFMAFSFAMLLLKFYGFSNRFVALTFPVAMVYSIRGAQNWPAKIKALALHGLLILSVITTFAVAMIQWRDPYGSQIMRDYVSMAEQAKKLMPAGTNSAAPLGGHWWTLTGHKAYYQPKNLLTSSEPTYVVALRDSTFQNVEEIAHLWEAGKIRLVDHDILKDGFELKALVEQQPNLFKLIAQNSRFSLYETVRGNG